MTGLGRLGIIGSVLIVGCAETGGEPGDAPDVMSTGEELGSEDVDNGDADDASGDARPSLCDQSFSDMYGWQPSCCLDETTVQRCEVDGTMYSRTCEEEAEIFTGIRSDAVCGWNAEASFRAGKPDLRWYGCVNPEDMEWDDPSGVYDRECPAD